MLTVPRMACICASVSSLNLAGVIFEVSDVRNDVRTTLNGIVPALKIWGTRSGCVGEVDA